MPTNHRDMKYVQSAPQFSIRQANRKRSKAKMFILRNIVVPTF